MTGKSDELKAVESEYDFVFGDDGSGTTTKASRLATVSCNTPTCDNRGHHIVIHDDTPQPIICGECGNVLYCDHLTTEETAATKGTLGAPVNVKETVCTACGLVLSHTEEPLPPIALADLPVQVLAALTGEL